MLYTRLELIYTIIKCQETPSLKQARYLKVADDTSVFSHVSDKYTSQSELNNDLQAISNWASQWKMQFNSNPNKQAQGVYFPKKGY